MKYICLILVFLCFNCSVVRHSAYYYQPAITYRNFDESDISDLSDITKVSSSDSLIVECQKRSRWIRNHLHQ